MLLVKLFFLTEVITFTRGLSRTEKATARDGQGLGGFRLYHAGFASGYLPLKALNYYYISFFRFPHKPLSSIMGYQYANYLLFSILPPDCPALLL